MEWDQRCGEMYIHYTTSDDGDEVEYTRRGWKCNKSEVWRKLEVRSEIK